MHLYIESQQWYGLIFTPHQSGHRAEKPSRTAIVYSYSRTAACFGAWCFLQHGHLPFQHIYVRVQNSSQHYFSDRWYTADMTTLPNMCPWHSTALYTKQLIQLLDEGPEWIWVAIETSETWRTAVRTSAVSYVNTSCIFISHKTHHEYSCCTENVCSAASLGLILSTEIKDQILSDIFKVIAVGWWCSARCLTYRLTSLSCVLSVVKNYSAVSKRRSFHTYCCKL